ncbi:MAG: hypothetical protein ACI906_003454 [Candidatus Latescibacterota bacterium]
MNIREEFLQNYLVHLKGAIPRELCDEWVGDYFEHTGIDESAPQSWPDDLNGFSKTTRTVPMAEASPQAWEAICELLGGEERIDERTRVFANGFNLNANRGGDQPWQGPAAQSPGWHKDGWFFRHFLDSPEQALLCLVIWRDIEPQSGGTFYAPDSVPLICRELLEHPEGLKHNHGWGRLIEQCRDFREMTAEAGDVIILHPYMLHAPSQNPSGRIRFMNNKVVSLKEPMRFQRSGGDYTPLEASILQALDVDELDFEITGQRKRSEDFSRLVEEEV